MRSRDEEEERERERERERPNTLNPTTLEAEEAEATRREGRICRGVEREGERRRRSTNHGERRASGARSEGPAELGCDVDVGRASRKRALFAAAPRLYSLSR
jgi:hypothetical protein